MKAQFVFLKIENVVLHRIYCKEGKKRIPPKVNHKVSPIDAAQAEVLQARITEVMGKNSHCVEMEIVRFGQKSTFQIIDKLSDLKDSDFAEESVELAERLTAAQDSAVIPGGVLICINGSLGDNANRFVGIIKAELKPGFDMSDDSGDVEMKLLRNLFLTTHQNLYKIGFFILKKDNVAVLRNPNDYSVYVFDQNMSKSNPNLAAKYFYEDFLGCRFCTSDAQKTRDFFLQTGDFINGLQLESDEKLGLRSSFFAYIKTRQRNLISSAEFSDEYLPEDVRDDYIHFMDLKEIPPRAFNRDFSFIEKEINNRSLHFSSHVQIIAPSDGFTDLVKIENPNDGQTIVKIKGKLLRDQ